jgi:alkylated DNA repair dioxygenase AlkB
VRIETDDDTTTRYFAQWLGHADELLRWCLDEIPWQIESIHVHGRTVAVPRLIAWYGDAGINYRYSGRDHVALGWPSMLDSLRDNLLGEFGIVANFALLNLYRDGADWMGWHRDDERGLGHMVASVSLGATRRFRVRDPAGCRVLELAHGSLLILDGTRQHTLARTRRPVAPRVNLTLRMVA